MEHEHLLVDLDSELVIYVGSWPRVLSILAFGMGAVLEADELYLVGSQVDGTFFDSWFVFVIVLDGAVAIE